MVHSSLLIFACMVAYVQAHGFMKDPPNRASLWRFGYDVPANYDDDGMNCGGTSHRVTVNGGRCGVCGDPYDKPKPRDNELGGKYGIGIIVANYEEDQTITTNIDLSAAHLCYWELRISQDPYCQEQDCFDNGYLLELVDGGTKFYPGVRLFSASYNATYRLPVGLTCEHCVLQWQYIAGNTWGVCANGTEALGCGDQEWFYSCTDISISKRSRPDVRSRFGELNLRWRRQHRGSYR